MADSVNLSRRSLIISMTLHGSLLIGGIFFINHKGSEVPHPPPPATTKVISRPIAVRPEPKPAVPSVKRADDVSSSPSRKLTDSVDFTAPPAVVQPLPPRSPKGYPSGAPSVTSERDYPQAQRYPRAAPRPAATERADSLGTPPSTPTPETASGWGFPVKTRPFPSISPGGQRDGGGEPAITRRAVPSFRPEFDLSRRFPELKSVSVKAEFKINEDGTFVPTLLTSSGDPTADVVILARLLEFQWAPALEKGKPMKDVRVLDVELSE